MTITDTTLAPTRDRELTIEDLHRIVGAPLHGAVLRRNGDLLEVAWEEPFGGRSGWQWALFRGSQFLSHGWTGGNRRDRDGDIKRAVDEYRARAS